MPTKKELLEKRTSSYGQARALMDKAGNEKRELTTDENGQYDKWMDEFDAATKELEGKEAEEKRTERFARATEIVNKSGERRSDPTPPGRGAPGRGAEGVGRDEVREVAWNVKGGDERRIRLSGRRSSEEYRTNFERYLASGKVVDLDEKERRTDDDEHRDLQADADAAGGYLMAPIQMVANLLKAVDDIAYVRQFATVYQLKNSQNLGCPTLENDPSDSDWTSEIKTGNKDTAMSFGKRELNPSPLAKRILVSRKLIRSGTMGVEALVNQRLAYKFGITEEKAFLTGTGANQPLGLFVASSNGISTGRDVSTGSATDFTADGLIDAKFTLKASYWNRPSTRWIMHRDGLRRVRKLKDSANQYLWTPGLAGGEPDRILDIPYLVSENAPNTFTTAKYVAILGDMSFYWIAESLGLEVQRLQELYAETNQIGFIGRMEVDGMPALEEAFVRLKTA